MRDAINQSVFDSQNIKSCWSKIKSTKGTEFFITHFYQILFEQHPEIKHLFPDDLTKLELKLINTLDNVINGFEYINELDEELFKLGQLHKNINIEKENYEIFITTIVEAANVSSNYQLSEKELESWEHAFRKVSNIMLKAY